ncbi:MAG TPA: CHAD domain-containing protein [Bryobacteraceae bacterium]|nr:CHAD domain-containing protein [Bryobacteraceae bacterium]
MKRLWKDSLNLRDNLRRRMPKIVAEYFADGRKSLAPATPWDEMHAFRLRSKRFRYTLETFRDVYGPAMDARIEALKKIQTYLGDINDLIVTSAILAKLPGTEEIRAELERKADEKTAKVQEHWATVFDAPGEERRWTMYLVNYACRPPIIPRARRIPARE